MNCKRVSIQRVTDLLEKMGTGRFSKHDQTWAEFYKGHLANKCWDCGTWIYFTTSEVEDGERRYTLRRIHCSKPVHELFSRFRQYKYVSVATKAMKRYIEKQGPQVEETVEAKLERVQQRLNSYYEKARQADEWRERALEAEERAAKAEIENRTLLAENRLLSTTCNALLRKFEPLGGREGAIKALAALNINLHSLVEKLRTERDYAIRHAVELEDGIVS